MEYEAFKKTLSKEEFFAKWETREMKALQDEIRDHIYKRYEMKCHVFQRDNFKCRNLNCKTPESRLTLHHHKLQKNFKDDEKLKAHRARNGVCLCASCHSGYHKAKVTLTFANDLVLPSHIRGRTYKLLKPDGENKKWGKKEKIRLRKMRKSLKALYGEIDYELLEILFRWLNKPYYKNDD